VCSHDEYHQINVDLVHRGPYRRIAAHYGLSEAAVRRHASEHIPQLLLEAYESLQRADAEDLATELMNVKADVHRLKTKAEEEGDLRTALTGCDKALKALELQAKVEQLIQTSPTVNIALVEHPDYQRLSDAIHAALDPYDEPRWAVAEALRAIE